MLDDILDFATLSLVDGGRLSFWMPTANDQDQEIKVPTHPCLRITSVCTQAFNKCKIHFNQIAFLPSRLTVSKGREDL
jgi:tRNA G10  N-methylase Trm11